MPVPARCVIMNWSAIACSSAIAAGALTIDDYGLRRHRAKRGRSISFDAHKINHYDPCDSLANSPVFMGRLELALKGRIRVVPTLPGIARNQYRPQ